MISIILNDNELDLFENTEVVWNWKGFRFQTAIRDGYTNNFQIPKTLHNIQVLGVYSLLDSPDIQFEGRLQPAVINLNGQIMPIYIQVVSINEKEIEICTYEDKLVYTIKGSKLGEIHDSPINIQNINTGEFTPKSIFEWNPNSSQLHPNVFKYYNYGNVSYNPQFAQVHGSIKLNDILDNIGQQHNVNIQHVSDLWRVICTKRYVCPENPIQVLEFNTTGALEDNLFTIFGGQHVTNDVDFAGNTEITFNRHTEVNIDIWFSWYKKGTTTNSFIVYVFKNDTIYDQIILNSGSYTSKYENRFLQMTFEEGDTLSFKCYYGNKYRSISFVCKLTHSNYEITEDDYGEDLLYKGRLPRLKTYNSNGGYNYIYFNGGYNIIQTENLSFSYFGLWCNLPEIQIGELLYSLQYILNARVVQRDNTIYFEPFVDRNSEVAGEMTSLKFHSGEVGKKNYIRWKDGNEQPPVVEIENEWLANEKVWSKNCFKWIKNNRVVPQYTLKIDENAELEGNDVEHYIEQLIQYEYDDFDEPVLLFFLPPHNQPATLHTFGLDRINNCKEVSFTLTEFPPDITDLDTIYVDGREYYIIEGEKNFKTGVTTIKALLVI